MSSWPTVNLIEVCEIEGGTQPPKETFRYEPTKGYVRMLQIQDFKSDESAVFIPEGTRMKTCVERDILIARYGASIGRILRGKAGAYNVALVKTVPDETRVERGFLYHLLNGHGFQHFILNVGSRAAQAGFNKGDLERFEFILPPLAEQRRIAEVLDRAEALRAKRRAALAQLDTLTQSLFLDLFGDPIANPKGWPVSPLSELGKIHTGKTPPTKLEGMFSGDIPFATPGDLDDGLRATERTLTEKGAEYSKVVRAGSALVGCIGNIGKMAKTPVRTSFNQQINAVEWGGRIHDDYGIAALPFQKHQMLSNASSTVVPILNKSGFSKVSIPVPPTELQREFARRVTAVEALKTAQRASLAALNALFASLQHRAFRGEL